MTNPEVDINSSKPNFTDEEEVQVWTVTHWPEECIIKNGPAPVLVYIENKLLFARNAGGDEYAIWEYPPETVWTRIL